MHLAMGTADRKAVDAFHAAALAAGGKDNGPPGVRTDYHPNYYAAFVHDPDGHNLEVVCHIPPGAAAAPAAKAKAPAKAKAKGGAKKAVAAKKPARKVAAKKKGRR